MKNNKWLKWIVGLGGISTFTLFLQAINTDEQANSAETGNVYNEKIKNVNQGQDMALSTNLEEREQQLLALDWTEGNWDVEYTNDAIIASPRGNSKYMNPADQRTRRS